MVKKYTGNYILTWLDKDDKSNSKVYNDYSTVLKARKRLLENEATSIDIAVEMKNVSQSNIE